MQWSMEHLSFSSTTIIASGQVPSQVRSSPETGRDSGLQVGHLHLEFTDFAVNHAGMNLTARPDSPLHQLFQALLVSVVTTTPLGGLDGN